VAAIAAGCSSPGSGGTSLPNSGAAASGLTAQPIGERGRVEITIFGDLPRSHDGEPYGPRAITAGPGGLLWVADHIFPPTAGEEVVVAITTSGARKHTYYYNGGPGSQGAAFDDIVEGPDGALWITDVWNFQILKLTPQGSYTAFPLPDYIQPLGICSGPDKALWFTGPTLATNKNFIGRITTGGRIKLFAISSSANDIATGPDGALWFTEPGAGRIARITTAGKITEYSVGGQPGSIAPGPDGALWFTDLAYYQTYSGQIGRITTRGIVSKYSQGITTGEEPQDLAAGPDGAMWFTEFIPYGSPSRSLVRGSRIGRITMNGKVTQYRQGLDRASAPTGIAAGPDGNIWFVEFRADKTGRVTL
jgi:sugar lactone lactonase YvrE